MIEDLFSNDADHLETLLATNTVDDHVAMDANEVLAVEYRVFILACSVYDLGRIVLILVSYDLGESVLNCGVVGVDKVAIDVVDCERALANRSAPHYRHLSLLLLRRHFG